MFVCLETISPCLYLYNLYLPEQPSFWQHLHGLAILRHGRKDGSGAGRNRGRGQAGQNWKQLESLALLLLLFSLSSLMSMLFFCLMSLSLIVLALFYVLSPLLHNFSFLLAPHISYHIYDILDIYYSSLSSFIYTYMKLFFFICCLSLILAFISAAVHLTLINSIIVLLCV